MWSDSFLLIFILIGHVVFGMAGKLGLDQEVLITSWGLLTIPGDILD